MSALPDVVREALGALGDMAVRADARALVRLVLEHCHAEPARVAEAVAQRDAAWRTALGRLVQPECPAAPGQPSECDPAMCDCLSPMQECQTIDECVQVLRDAHGRAHG